MSLTQASRNCFAALCLVHGAPVFADSCQQLQNGETVSSISSKQFLSLVKDLLPEAKSEFETTADYKERSEKALRKIETRLSEVVVTKKLATTMYFSYDADAGLMNYKDPSGVSCSSSGNECRSTIDIKILDRRTSEHTELVFDRSAAKQIFPSFGFGVEPARQLKQNGYNYDVAWIAVLKVKSPYLIESVSSGLGQVFYMKSIPVEVICTSWSIKPTGI